MKRIAAAAAMFLAVSLTAQGAVPQRINFQGKLTDTVGSPIDGIINIDFTLYDAGVGGSSVWTETQSVAANNGLFSADLGSTTPITAAILTSAPQLWLALDVDSDGEMVPRFKLASAPFAIFTDPASHQHSSLDASDGTPQDALSVDAAGDVHLTGSVIYDTSQTRYLQLPPAEFKLASTYWEWMVSDDRAYIPSGAPNVWAAGIAPVHLPANAVIEEVTVFYVDNAATDNLIITFYLRSFSVQTGGVATLASATDTTIGSSTNVQSLTDTTITSPTVNNSTYQHTLEVIFNPGMQGPTLRFCGAKIQYSVSQP